MEERRQRDDCGRNMGSFIPFILLLIKCTSLCSASFRLPVPKLEDTITRYLNAQKPLLNDDQFRYGQTNIAVLRSASKPSVNIKNVTAFLLFS